MSAQPTHPGLAYLRARAEWDQALPSRTTADHGARLAATAEAWVAANCPTDLVPESDLRAAEREIGRLRGEVTAWGDRTQAAERERDAARAQALSSLSIASQFRDDWHRLQAENARLTRGPLGRLLAMWGGR